MSTVFALSDQARPNAVATLLEKSKGSLDDPSRFAIVSTKTGKVVLAGADAPAKPGPVDVMAQLPGSTEQQRVVGQVYVTAQAKLFGLVGKTCLATTAACLTGAAMALAEGRWELGLVGVVVSGWAAIIAGAECALQGKTAAMARRALRAEGVDLAKVNPEPETGFAEILARSSMPY